jgi:hypothetical protein
VHQLARVILFAIGAAIVSEGPAIEQMATCRNVVCLKDAYFTLHRPSEGATFFYHARMLQMYPHNRASELAILETLPQSAAAADALMSFGRVGLPRGKAIELRDAIRDDMPRIYWHAARRHRQYMPRLLASRQWMDECYSEELDRLCAEAKAACEQ